jgi:HD superfamily phosphohydrolase
MQIQDKIYGTIEITEPVIIDLINTANFQRLKRISQDGAAHFIQPQRNVTRFEHSVGAWYLSMRYKRSIEEQIASLLHDISHTAFSHVIDLVVKSHDYGYADSKLNAMIMDSPIPEIIKSHGFDLTKVLDKSHYPLLDNSLPDLSVDRWDYFMRDAYAIGFLPKQLIEDFLNNISEKDNIFYFKDLRLASTFAILFANCSRLIWLDPTAHGAFFLLSKAIATAFEKGIISEDDFFSDDETLLNKIKAAQNSQVEKFLARLVPGNEFVYTEQSKAEFFGPNKPRFVNPFVEQAGSLVRIADLVPSLKYFFEEFTEKYKQIGVRQLD